MRSRAYTNSLPLHTTRYDLYSRHCKWMVVYKEAQSQSPIDINSPPTRTWSHNKTPHSVSIMAADLD